jgi:hypothetical protein
VAAALLPYLVLVLLAVAIGVVVSVVASFLGGGRCSQEVCNERVYWQPFATSFCCARRPTSNGATGPDAMKRGVLILLVCFLVAGSLASAIGFVADVRPLSLEDADQFRDEFQRNMELWQQFMPPQDAFMTQASSWTSSWTTSSRAGASAWPSTAWTPLCRAVWPAGSRPWAAG